MRNASRPPCGCCNLPSGKSRSLAALGMTIRVSPLYSAKLSSESFLSVSRPRQTQRLCSYMSGVMLSTMRTKSFASSRLEKQSGRSANAMTKIVKKNLSDSRLTVGRKRRLEKLSRRPDSEINTSDIPELTEKFWQNAVRNPFYRPLKQQLTLRLDADIIAWLRRQGRGYQTRANALLRTAMLGDLNPKRKRQVAQK